MWNEENAMKKLITVFTMTTLTWGLLAVGQVSEAQQGRAAEQRPAHIQLAQATNGINRDEAAKIAKARYGGKILNVSKSSGGSSTTYQVKLLQKSGRVKIVSVGSDENIR